MHNISLREIREIAPGLYFGRDQGDMGRLFEPGKFRGYVIAEETRSGFKFRVDCWNADHTTRFRRRYRTKAGAERGLVQHGTRIATPTAA